MLGLIGKKLGMTQVYNKDGNQIPVTVLQVGPCSVVQRKNKNTDGYNALQLGFEDVKPTNLSKAKRMHCEKKGIKTYRHLREFRTNNVEKFEVGQVLTVKGFKPGDAIDVIGTTKGRGFQGVIKRHGKHGGPASHGSDFHRRPGSTGMRTWPGRLFKNTRLPGHFGVDRVTIQNITVVEVRPEENILLIKGGIPGPRQGLVLLVNKAADFEDRKDLIEQAATETPVAKAEETKTESAKEESDKKE